MFALVAVAAASLVAGCAGGPALNLAGNPSPDITAASAEAPASAHQNDLQKATAYWGKAFANDPRDARAAVALARNLKAMGERTRALTVLQEAHQHNPSNREINSEYGRLALEAGQIPTAQKLLDAADDVTNPDWRVISARGTILAKQGKHKEAIALYERALQLAPDQTSILNNLALAHAMDGRADKAEPLLKRAAEVQGADPRVSQNLSLVLGLQGKHGEARTIAAKAMPSDEARDNVEFVRAMVGRDAPSEPSVTTAVALPEPPKAPGRARSAGTVAASGKAAPIATSSTGTVDAGELVRRLADGEASAMVPAPGAGQKPAKR
jgi:Flp pilus assembly protein TadD